MVTDDDRALIIAESWHTPGVSPGLRHRNKAIDMLLWVRAVLEYDGLVGEIRAEGVPSNPAAVLLLIRLWGGSASLRA